MVVEIGELDSASQIARSPGRVGDALHVAAVVVVLGPSKQRQRAELNRAHSAGVQLVDCEVRTLEHFV